MTDKSSFTDSEWQTLLFTPLWVFFAVAGADQNVDEKEVESFTNELQQAVFFKEPLVRDVLLGLAGDFQKIMEAFQKDRRDVLAGLNDAGSLLDTKATTDSANNFKRAMLLIGRNIAQASGGGPLGMGDKVSDQEKQAIVLVAAALKVKI